MGDRIVVIDIEGLEEGMIAAEDVPAFDGTIIVHKGMELEGKHIGLFRRALVTHIKAIIPEKAAEKKETIHISDYTNNQAYLEAARILVVDDSKFLRYKLEKILTEAGLKVIGQATNGKEAVEMAIKLQPNLVTLDVEMPNHDGISAVKPIREALPDTIVIMISSIGEEDKILQALANGAFDFISKPIDPARTVKSIINAIIVERAYK
jgi:two-component system, chemotaxis family, chemotaxis protein CheY